MSKTEFEHVGMVTVLICARESCMYMLIFKSETPRGVSGN